MLSPVTNEMPEPPVDVGALKTVTKAVVSATSSLTVTLQVTFSLVRASVERLNSSHVHASTEAFVGVPTTVRATAFASTLVSSLSKALTENVAKTAAACVT